MLGRNNGWYQGLEAIDGYYRAVSDGIMASSRLMAELFPENWAAKAKRRLRRGDHDAPSADRRLWRSREDGQTAKGLLAGHGLRQRNYGSGGPISNWKWGWAAADLVLEDGEWKVWHFGCWMIWSPQSARTGPGKIPSGAGWSSRRWSGWLAGSHQRGDCVRGVQQGSVTYPALRRSRFHMIHFPKPLATAFEGREETDDERIDTRPARRRVWDIEEAKAVLCRNAYYLSANKREKALDELWVQERKLSADSLVRKELGILRRHG